MLLKGEGEVHGNNRARLAEIPVMADIAFLIKRKNIREWQELIRLQIIRPIRHIVRRQRFALG